MLARDTYELSDAYISEYNKTTYKYEVELISLSDLMYKFSVTNTEDYKKFKDKEIEKNRGKEYDMDYNIRDLYPIEIHLENKNENDISKFENLNSFILSLNDKITRRVTKKEIVYKKNKSKSILSIILTKNSGIKLFVLPIVEELDFNNKFFIISSGNRKPLECCIKIRDDEDLKYVKLIIKKYFQKIL